MNISTIPKDGRRFVMTICVDDEPWQDVHVKIFGRSLSFPTCVTLEQLQEQFLTLEYTKVKKYALDCLAMRSYPSTELKKLLEKNLVTSKTIEKIIQEFSCAGYLNDDEWIERYIKAQLRRHVGPQIIISKLMKKGFTHQQAENWIGALMDVGAIQNSIEHLLKTKYKSRNLSDYREKHKVFASLARKGFDISAIKAVLDKA